MRTGPLYNKLLANKKKFVVCQGGGDAGKTVTILQYLATMATQKPNQIITVVGQDIPNLKKGALRSFQRYVASDPDIASHIRWPFHSTSRTYTFLNGSIIEFVSFEDEQDARGSERDYLFVNEANYINYSVFWQLKRKTRVKVLVDYNPTSSFWVHEKLLSKKEKEYPAEKVQFYRVDHRHNPFLAEDEHEAYESISDPELFKVYARGKLGKIRGLIFGHFRKAALADVPNMPYSVDNPGGYERIVWAIDYGYTNDPTVLVKITIKGRKRWIKEIIYEPALVDPVTGAEVVTLQRKETTALDLKNALLANGYERTQQVYSEADPNMINQLRILGIECLPAIKGPGSIIAGIAKVREYECYYYDSPNGEKEISIYKWVVAEDVITGKEVMTNQPIDAWNHYCDASRYGIYTDSFRHARAA